MNNDEINVDDVLKSIDNAVDQGNYRKSTKKESMEVRLAALSEIVRNMQIEVKKDRQLVHA